MRGALLALSCCFALNGPTGSAPPLVPVNNSPPDAATLVPADPMLCVNVADPDDDPLQVEFFGRELTAAPAADFTIVALPDTQYYSQTYPEIFISQTSWIVAQREALNIVFVTHLGDIVQVASSQLEWNNADAAMSLLEDPGTTGLADGIPYGNCVGNHDQSPSNEAGSPADDDETTVLYNQVFGVSRFAGRGYYGGHYSDNNDSSFQLFSAGGIDFIIIHLEFDDTFDTILDDITAWADGLLATYGDRQAIISSHSLLCTGTVCPQSETAEFSTQGQRIYDAVKDNKNLFLMLCGHAGESMYQPRRSDTFDGHTIHTLMSNYQRGEDCPLRCGNGYLRIYTFSPQNDQISSTTYSPWLDAYKTDVHHQFSVPYDMEGGIAFEQIGSLAGVPSGMSACTPWTGRQQDAQYEWYAEVSDGSASVTGPRWTFSSNGSCNLAGDCDDQAACTADSCDAGTCLNDPIPNCCVSDAECDDADPCTDDLCAAGACTHPQNTAPCTDGDPCTEGDACSAGTCAGTALDCDDSNACTLDSCNNGSCESDYFPSAGCCLNAGHCDDGDRCTDDRCTTTNCSNAAIPGCCAEDFQCNDSDVCTQDTCPQRNEAALQLDGVDDHVTMGKPDGLGFPTGLNAATFTVECWFKWDGTGLPAQTWGWPNDAGDVGGLRAYPLVTKGREDRDDITERSVNYYLGILPNNQKLAADFEEHATGSDPGANHPVSGGTAVTTGVWHHAAATYDGNCWQLYLDGVPQTPGTNCPGEPAAYEALSHTAVGTAQESEGWSSGHFGGSIDEVRIWNRALGPAEIAANMFEQIESHPDLLGRWALDESMGFVTDDSTGNGHVAVIVGGNLQTSDVVDLGGGVCELDPLPFEVALLSMGPNSLDWTDQGAGILYDVAGGTMAELHSGSGTDLAQCLADDVSGTSLPDPRPDPTVDGEGFYYFVRSDDPTCGPGTYGFATPGPERLPLSDCP